MISPRRPRFLPDPDKGESTFVGDLLRQETTGGAIVLAAALVAVVWANSPFADAYTALRHLIIGPLDVEEWAADGALALFFFLAGLELKREMLVGSLRRPADAAVPIVAALAGVATPALVYTAVNLAERRAAPRLGDPGRDGHRVRARGARRGGRVAADVAAGLPAHPGRGRRPRGDHRDRGVLHLDVAPGAAAAGGGAAGDVRVAAAPAGHVVPGLRAARGRHLVVRATRAACTRPSPGWRWGC